ncbi:delta-class carbonic anhydrase [Pseudoalteromonas sp. T1lg23B]|uniref:delta-class carbonic anhydrase n=1 Tax=Pseudoalteromonas sp. T1lg23B TaxID=2077097 RepID=UPI000CF7386F|nr:delta-class carbonic anhydrase [Pseudoalteromonas sp. T1lg23B]
MKNIKGLAVALSVLLPNYVLATGNLASIHAHLHETKTSNARGVSDKLHGFGPQSPRDIDSTQGLNPIVFSAAPKRDVMNLCNIHFHKNAEHRGGEFNRPADASEKQMGFVYSGTLSRAQRAPVAQPICPSDKLGLNSGDTIELHYVHSSAPVAPGSTLSACLSEHIKNPQLRVEAQVMVLTNDGKGVDFNSLTKFEQVNGYYQAPNIPSNTGQGVEYTGSTTGPNYNRKGSPFKVTWNVRPQVLKVDIHSLGTWCSENPFQEHAAHGVRDLVTAPEHLSPILN